ncbi:MAG: hypothetical protein Kow0040_17030 [Thermogutta sp.]
MKHLATQAGRNLRGGGPSRRGLTLLELLVVVTIMLILLAVMVPRLRPMMEQRRMREAARTVSVFFAAARSRAMETGRPVGVSIERLKIQPDAAVSLRMVEEPPLYAGDVIGARVRVRRLGATNRFQVLFEAPGDVAAMLTQVVPVHIGDLVRFEYQAVPYRVVGLDTDFDGNPDADPDDTLGDPAFPVGVNPVAMLVELDPAEGVVPAWPSAAPNAPWPPQGNGVGSQRLAFQITRRPEPTAAAPVRLPGRTVIDLTASGTDSMALTGPPLGFVPVDKDAAAPGVQDPSSVIVMFNPDGRVSTVYYQDTPRAVTEVLYFLVGRWERMPADSGGAPLAEDGLYNWQDITNFWIVINPNTGLVLTAPLLGDTVAATGVKTPSTLVVARDDARNMRGIGGR